MEEVKSAYKILVAKPEEKRKVGVLRRGWDSYIKMDFRELCLDGLYWIRLAEVRDIWRAVVNTEVILRVS
jgi:hypothetical protein